MCLEIRIIHVYFCICLIYFWQENKISDLMAQLKQQSVTIQHMKDVPVSMATGSPAEFKHMLTRVKGDYEQEIHRLKEYFGKEKQR